VAERWRLSLSARSRENLARLEDPRAVLVITGQQPAFLTGPLYTIYKAISAIAAARRLEEDTGRPHVPVFWVASEDHDLDEARGVAFPGPGDSSVEFALPHAADRRPLSAYPVDRPAEEVIDAVLAHLSGRRFTDAVRDLAALYRGRDLAGGFGAVLAALFADQGLLFIEPEILRPRVAPLFRACLEDPPELLARVAEGIRQVEERGIAAQVPARFPLFMLSEGKRHHLAPEEGGAGGPARFRLEGTGRTWSRDELLSILETEPERFSTGVLLRPVAQNAVLPNAVYLGGPAELAYFAQIRPIFEWFDLPPPSIALRLSATLIEGKVARALRRLSLEPGDPGAAETWAGARVPEDLLPATADGPEAALAAAAGETRARLLESLADPRIPAVARRRLESAARKIASEIESLGARAGRAARQGRGEEMAAAEKVFRNFFPDGRLQERRWNIFHYLAKYGTGFLLELIDAAARDPFRAAHRWVSFQAESEGEKA
jgi:bacillithiol biosynthesis cysteine-adding enzyme BshC